MAATPAPRKLMLIAVDVDSGTVNEPYPNEPNPRVVGIVDSQDFDNFVALALNPPAPTPPKAHRSHKAATHDEPYSGGPATHVATILHTQHSPGCTWVIINGWPFCIR